LLADASVNVADWLLALGGEALANMIDYQGFVGGANTGDPFLGVLNYPSKAIYSGARNECAVAMTPRER